MTHSPVELVGQYSRYSMRTGTGNGILLGPPRLGGRLALRLAAASDALIGGYRPGVAERFGVGPADCLARNATLVYGGATTIPRAASAGHDIAYRTHRHADRRVPPGDRSCRSAYTREVLASLGFHDAEDLYADSAVIRHAAGSDLE
jgi:CoA-transferase family III